MVGQKNLLNTLKNSLPNNVLLIGDKLMGKKTLAREVARNHGLVTLEVNKGVDNIKKLNKYSSPEIVFLIADLEDWSPESIEALLIPLENNVHQHFIITCDSLALIPSTLISRCYCYNMEPYSPEDIGNKYCNSVGQAKLFTQELLNDVDDLIANHNLSYFTKYANENTDLFFTVLENRLLELGESRKYSIAVKYRLALARANRNLIFSAFLVEFNG